MSETNGLHRRIREKLEANEEARRLRQDQRRQATVAVDERLIRYTAVADRLMKEVILPCMQQLADCFAGVERPEDQQSRHTSVCRFPHTDRFPATSALEVGLTRDGEARTVIVQYDLEILPIYHSINAHAHLDMPLDEVDQPRVAHWVVPSVKMPPPENPAALALRSIRLIASRSRPISVQNRSLPLRIHCRFAGIDSQSYPTFPTHQSETQQLTALSPRVAFSGAGFACLYLSKIFHAPHARKPSHGKREGS